MAQATGTDLPPEDKEAAPLRRMSRDRLLHELRRPRTSLFSPLLIRIFAINSISVFIILAGLLYVSQYQDQQIVLAQRTLQREARFLANALAGSADIGAPGAEKNLKNLVNASETRARLFDAQGMLIADTAWGQIDFSNLIDKPVPIIRSDKIDAVIDFISQSFRSFPTRQELPRFDDAGSGRAVAYPDAERALSGTSSSSLWRGTKNNLVLMAAAPIVKDDRIAGTVLLTRSGDMIDMLVRQQRSNAFVIVVLGLAATLIVSIYLALSIGRPIRKLARAARDIQTTQGRQVDIPDMGTRRDEIGDLFLSFRAMLEDIRARMDALDQFAADVSHELKNPLTSLRSAIETLAIVQKPEQQQRLYRIIQDDVQRLDRLISDIATLSRLDAQLSRAIPEKIMLSRILSEIVQSYNASSDDVKVVLLNREQANLPLLCVVSRFEQVLRNLIDNALSFASPGDRIAVSARKKGNSAEVSIDDEGPGIPEDRLEKVFDRFYTDRDVSGEKRIAKFSGHSGLGLSIAKKIIEAAGGEIHAENRVDRDGKIIGARFVFTLPLAL